MVNDHRTELDATFAALSDPTRRAFIARLAREPATPTMLGKPHAISRPAVSRHLRVLERAGLITRVRRGRVHELRLAPGALERAATWIAEHRAFWERQLDSLERYLDETHSKGDTRWRSRKRTSRSASSGASRTPATSSSRPGRTPKS